MAKMLINDTVDAVVKRKRDQHLFITAETQLGSLSQSLGVNESIFAGIGNRKISQIRSQKEMTSTLRNALFDLEILSMTQGVEIEDNSVGAATTIYRKEDALEVVPNGDEMEPAFQVVLDETNTENGVPTDETVVQVRNTAGEIAESKVDETGVIPIPEGHATEGERVSIFYQDDVTTGETVEFRSDKFSEAYEIEYHTIAYDPDTNTVVSDIYIQLDHVLPSSDFEMSFENGTAQTPEITFDCMAAPNTNSMGRIVVVPREEQ